MFKINANKIIGKMAEKNLTQAELACKLDITRDTLRNYIKEPERMPYRIIDKLADELCDSYKEAQEIFFAR